MRPSPSSLAQSRLIRTLDSAYNTLNLTHAARNAISRSPAMARSAAQFAAVRAKAEDQARADAAVVGAALDVGVYERSSAAGPASGPGGPGKAGHTARSRAGAREFVRGQWGRVIRRAV